MLLPSLAEDDCETHAFSASTIRKQAHLEAGAAWSVQ